MTPTASIPTRSRSRDASASLVAFAISTASLYIFDIFLGQQVDSEALAQWAFARSAIFIGAAFAVRGMDQALLRHQVDFDKLWKPLLVQSFTLGLVPGLISLAALSLREAVLVFISASLLSFFLGLGGFLRSDYRIAWSVSTIHGWKVLLIAIGAPVVLLGWVGQPIVLAPMVLLAHLVLALSICRHVAATARSSDYDFADALPIAKQFWITSMVASGFVFVDQIVLNLDGAVDDSALLFLYSSILLPIPIFVAGFGANLLNPWLRQSGERLRGRLVKLSILFVSAGIAVVIAAQILGLVLGNALGRFDGRLDWSLFVGIGALSFLRFLYVAPSGAVGVFGSASDLRTTASGGVLAIVLIPITYLPATRWLGWMPADAILASMIVSGATRVGVAVSLVVRIMSRSEGSLTINSHG